MSSPNRPRERTCSNCGNRIPPGTQALCPTCHHPFIFDFQDYGPDPVADPPKPADGGGGYFDALDQPDPRLPGPERGTAQPGPVRDPGPRVAQPGPADASGLICRACRFANVRTRIRCERCAELLAERPVIQAVQPRPEPAPRQPIGMIILVMLGALILAGAFGVGAYFVFR